MLHGSTNLSIRRASGSNVFRELTRYFSDLIHIRAEPFINFSLHDGLASRLMSHHGYSVQWFVRFSLGFEPQVLAQNRPERKMSKTRQKIWQLIDSQC